jgi:hypothetical protein
MQTEARLIGKQLIERDLLHAGTKISAKVTVKGFGHSILNTEKEGIVSAVTADGLEVIYEDRKKRLTDFEQITAIEGMELVRFAQAYRVKLPIKRKKA